MTAGSLMRWADVGKLRQPAKRALFRAMAPIERANHRSYRLRYPPGFIVAPPRAGTTLVRMLMSTGLETSYFSNLTASTAFALGYPLPVTSSWLANKMKPRTGFRNEYGRIAGPGAPAEGEVVWAHWFGTRYDAVAPADLTEEQAAAMYRAVAAAEHMLGAPFVNKTTTLALRIEALVRVFPDAYFVRVRRDPLDTAQSLYVARTTRYEGWLGARPPECVGSEDRDLITQVAMQIHFVERHLDAGMHAVGDDRFLEVRYEDVCTDPRGQFERIRGFMAKRGAVTRERAPIPESFDVSHGQKVDDATYAELARALDTLSRSDP